MVLLTILLSILVCFIVVRFARFTLAVAMILLGLVFLGVLIIPFNPAVGIAMVISFACLISVLIMALMFSGLVSLLIVTPLFLLWQGIKMLFNK